jgi:hypothetical protein
MDQVRSLRARTILGHFVKNPGSGAYLMMGNTAKKILEEAGLSEEEVAEIAVGCMPDEEVKAAARFSTTLRRLEEAEFDRIYRHGWEVANCTLLSRTPTLFKNIPASRS